MPDAVAIVALTQKGLATARRIGAGLTGARVHGYAPRVSGADVEFDDVGAELRRLFASDADIVGVCAAGILIRTLAPALADKRRESAVVAVAEDASAVVPLLGGHRGANALARRLGAALGVPAAITTAGESRWQVALDDPPPGWVLANPHHCKSFMARLLAGERCRLEGEQSRFTLSGGEAPLPAGEGFGVREGPSVGPLAGRAVDFNPLTPGLSPAGREEESGDSPAPASVKWSREGEADWLRRSGIEFQADAPLAVRVTDAPEAGDEDTLVYHRRRFALGVGCERGIAASELEDLVERTLADADLSPRALAGVFSVDVKADEPAVHALADALGVPARFFDPPTLEALTPRLANPSDAVFREVGCHGVSEAAALAAAGSGGTLRVTKTKSRRATCAIGEAPRPIDAMQVGRARGALAVVGLGPGTPAWRTPAADRAIGSATHLVGYRGYLDMVPASRGQVRHAYALGEETDRVDQALALAAGGDRVALVCSGDPGVYAMAALVFERLELAEDPGWRRSEIVVIPGVSAMHGAAALAGAPLGHDFCAVSLSDLLTPWAAIERRLEAAAAGDFVVALYNPASVRRRRGLARALEILAAKRPPSTPVVVARAVGREEQSVTTTCLRDLDQSSVDMMTLLIVGSTETRSTGGHVYTPRGYRAKRGPMEDMDPREDMDPGEDR